MARRNEHSLDEIKKMVLDAAEAIIIKEGYPALTVRKIALDIGYSVASFYMVFTNMADLILHIKSNTVDELTRHLQQTPSPVPEQYITELGKTYLHFAVKNFNRWSMIYVAAPQTHETYRQKITQLYSPLEAQLAILAPEYPAQQSKQAARTLWYGIHGICNLYLNGNLDADDIDDAEQSIVLLVESFIDGWVKKRTNR